jgi:SAM-dependent methyltransferase
MDVQQNQENSVHHICAVDDELTKELKTSGQFDFLLCTEVLEHVAKWNIAFDNLNSLTAKSGRVLITCPHFYQLHEEPFDFWRPTNHALRFYAQKYGFKVIYEEAAGDAWDVLGTLLASTKFAKANNRILDKVLNLIADKARKWLFWQLKTRRIQKYIVAKGPFYISNVILLEKL